MKEFLILTQSGSWYLLTAEKNNIQAEKIQGGGVQLKGRVKGFGNAPADILSHMNNLNENNILEFMQKGKSIYIGDNFGHTSEIFKIYLKIA
ncbi:MAG: hypothetical protein QXE31_00690 [Candidatus Woesearchaeota archaeon]